jgi:ligand-binding sensor domain-containing protein
MRVIISIILLGLVQAGMSEEPYAVKNQSSLLSRSLNCIDAGEFALWVGSDKGINRIEITKDSISQVSARQTSKAVLSICNDNNFLWVGIAQKGLYLFDKRSYVFEGHFKKQLRLTNITSINKVGGKLLLKTKSNNNFVVDLSDTSLHSSSLNDPIKDKFNDFVSYQGQKYQASSTGLFVRKANSNGDDLVAVKDTSAQVLQKDTIDQQESKLVSSVIVKQDKLIKNDQRCFPKIQ